VSFGIERPLPPDRIAAVLAYLLSPEGHTISGDVIELDDRPWVGRHHP
jgi:hypothetical protein